jgi:hypothetical protein
MQLQPTMTILFAGLLSSRHHSRCSITTIDRDRAAVRFEWKKDAAFVYVAIC